MINAYGIDKYIMLKTVIFRLLFGGYLYEPFLLFYSAISCNKKCSLSVYISFVCTVILLDENVITWRFRAKVNIAMDIIIWGWANVCQKQV